MTKLPLRATPHSITVMPRHGALCIAVSSSEPYGTRPAADTPPSEPVPAPLWREEHEVRLLDQASWATLDKHVLPHQEFVMTSKLLQLKDESHVGGGSALVSCLVVATAIQLGEVCSLVSSRWYVHAVVDGCGGCGGFSCEEVRVVGTVCVCVCGVGGVVGGG